MTSKHPITLISLIALMGCSESSASSSDVSGIHRETHNEQGSVPENPGSIKLMFALSGDAIGANPAYVEQKLGVPRIKNAYQMVFELEGCTIDYGLDETSITSIRVDITDQCQPLIDGKRITPSTTFGDLAQDWSTYIADCFSGCGNAYDPSISLRFNGSRSNGFISVTYGAGYDKTAEAQDIWSAELRERLGIGPFDTPDDPDAMSCVKNPSPKVKAKLHKVPISSVHIFSNVEDPHC